MRYFIIAGEASGDLHASGVARELQRIDNQATLAGWGGDHMADNGVDILKHYRELAFMGFVEVAMNLRTILGNLRLVKQQVQDFGPDALILVDYPGFNLRIAKWAKGKGIPVHYYISPQLWAWKEGRVKKVRQFIDAMYVILPFEKDFYRSHGIDVHYVGHPLLEAIARFRASRETSSGDNVIAILAGSRKQEISHILPTMLSVAEGFPDEQFVVAAAPNVDEDFYRKFLSAASSDNVEIVYGDTYGVLDSAKAAMTTSGTATLETALFGVPQVVCYRGSRVSFEIAKRLVRVPFISLVNLILAKPVVEELIQDNVTTVKLSQGLTRILEGDMRKQIKKDYKTLNALLDEGGASQQVAEYIYASISMDS